MTNLSVACRCSRGVRLQQVLWEGEGRVVSAGWTTLGICRRGWRLLAEGVVWASMPVATRERVVDVCEGIHKPTLEEDRRQRERERERERERGEGQDRADRSEPSHFSQTQAFAHLSVSPPLSHAKTTPHARVFNFCFYLASDLISLSLSPSSTYDLASSKFSTAMLHTQRTTVPIHMLSLPC